MFSRRKGAQTNNGNSADDGQLTQTTTPATPADKQRAAEAKVTQLHLAQLEANKRRYIAQHQAEQATVQRQAAAAALSAHQVSLIKAKLSLISP